MRRRYPSIIRSHEAVGKSAKEEIGQNAKGLSMHGIGAATVHGLDGMTIPGFIWVSALGRCGNCTYVCGVMVSVISLLSSPLTSVMGHLRAGGDEGKIGSRFDYFYCMDLLGAVFFWMCQL